MMRYFILFCFFSIFHNHLISQILVANVKIVSCSSCYNAITLLDNETINIPKFIIFPLNSKSDSLEIENRYKFAELGFHYLFNDELYLQTNSDEGASTLSYFNTNAKLEWTVDIKSIDSSWLQEKKKYFELEKRPSGFLPSNYLPNYNYSLNLELGILRIYNNQDSLINAVKPANFPFDLLISKLNAYDKALMLSRGLEINKNFVGFSNIYNALQFDKNGNVYMIYEYINLMDSTSNNAKTPNCYVKLTPEGEILDLFPIVDKPTHTIFSTAFLVPSSDKFITITHDYRDWIKELAKLGKKDFLFLSEFQETGDSFVFSKEINYKLPKIYAEKYFENYLSLLPSAYPIIALPLSNELFNLLNGKKAYVINDSLYNAGIVYGDTTFSPETENLKTHRVEILPSGDFCVFYQYKGNWFMNRYSNEMELKKIIDFSFLSPFISPDFMVLDKPSNRLFFYERFPGKKIVLPFSPFL